MDDDIKHISEYIKDIYEYIWNIRGAEENMGNDIYYIYGYI